ncbi:MAG: peptidoglycan editing factor PgeF [Rubrivivax sp.]
MSTRAGGVSAAPWDSMNLGVAVGDDASVVAENRRRFAALIDARPVWLRQVHGHRAVRVSSALVDAEPLQADASWTDEPGVACTVQVADCLPVLLAAPGGRAVAAAHAGWRGLAGGVIEAALQALCDGAHCLPADVEVWLGPCIGPRQFEVGADVLKAFGASPAQADPRLFVPRDQAGVAKHWLANLPQLARERLRRCGVRRISGGEWCTVEDRSRFFSYRRDGITGRLAAAVWIRG